MKTTIQELPESQFKNSENHNSGMMKTTIQEYPESQFKNDENHASRMVEITTQECSKSQSNNTDINDTDLSENEYSETEYSKKDFNETDSSMSVSIYPNHILSIPSISDTETDVIDEIETYRRVIRENISYECLLNDQYYRREEVDELVELIVEVMLMPDNGMLQIAGVKKRVPIVKSRFMKLDKMHIEYIFNCLSSNTTKVSNIKAYLLTALYNAPMTIKNYYAAEVNHDLYGSG